MFLCAIDYKSTIDRRRSKLHARVDWSYQDPSFIFRSREAYRSHCCP